MNIKISTTNSKLGLIPSISLPPITTCRINCPCGKDCYAMKGNYRFQNVQESMEQNLSFCQRSREGYFGEIIDYINNGVVIFKYFRWHAAGDIIDEEYFKGMINVALKSQHTSFLAFTKKYELVNDWMTKDRPPKNLNIIFSAWGDDFVFQTPFNLPVAYIKFKDADKNTRIPNTAIKCSGDCTNCLQCWNIKCGQSVVFNKH